MFELSMTQIWACLKKLFHLRSSSSSSSSSSSWPSSSSYYSPITLILIIVMVFVYTKLDRSNVHQTNSKLTHWPNSKKIAKMWPNLRPTNLFYIWVFVFLKNIHFCICIFVFIFLFASDLIVFVSCIWICICNFGYMLIMFLYMYMYSVLYIGSACLKWNLSQFDSVVNSILFASMILVKLPKEM